MLFSGACATTAPLPRAWRSVPVAPAIGSLHFDADGKLSYAAEAKAPPSVMQAIHLSTDAAGARLMNGTKALTDPFPAIDSWDVSASRGEVVFSARRGDNFDIGLVSTDGGAVHWVPSDPSDEVGVQWAPRGNKVSYLLRTRSGDVVRTLHVPTSYQLSVDFPYAHVRALAWEPKAERYAVSYSTPDGSDRIEELKYGGEDRHVTLPPASTLDADLQPIAPDAVILRPRDVAYQEKMPLTVWVQKDYGWNDAAAAVWRAGRSAAVITTAPPGEALWKAIAATPWIDPSRIWVVSTQAVAASAGAPPFVLVTADPGLPPGRYLHSGNVVRAAPAVVQSVASGFIADQLKRITPTNGSRR